MSATVPPILQRLAHLAAGNIFKVAIILQRAMSVLSTEAEACLEVKVEPKDNLHITDDGNSQTCMINKTSQWSLLAPKALRETARRKNW